MTAPAITASAKTSADAKLIRLYAQLAALNQEFDALYDQRTSIAEEDATQDELDVLYDRRDALMAEIEAAGPPQTMAGVIATARTALAINYQRDSDGDAIANDDSHFLLLMACEALTANA
jgi:hypothetical protein